MLADAFAAERLRLSKAKGTLFWGLIFVPIVVVLWSIVQALFVSTMAQKSGVDPARVLNKVVDLSQQAVGAVNFSGIFLVQIFFMICASQILAGDYRWETWRLFTPRNTRVNLMVGKLLTFGVAAGAGLAALAVAGLLSGVADAAIVGSKPVFSQHPGEIASAFAGTFLVAWLELLAMGALAALVAVVTRNGVASLLVPIALWIVQGFVGGAVRQGFPNPSDPPVKWLAALPALSVDTLKGAVSISTPDFATPTRAPFALAFLLLWIVGLVAATLFLFRRQDLTRE